MHGMPAGCADTSATFAGISTPQCVSQRSGAPASGATARCAWRLAFADDPEGEAHHHGAGRVPLLLGRLPVVRSKHLPHLRGRDWRAGDA